MTLPQHPPTIPHRASKRSQAFVVRELVVGTPAVVLLLAAALKWHELPIVNRTGQGVLHAPWLIFTQIHLEFALALWLLSGLLPLWSRRSAIAVFSLFASVAAYKALTGADSCNCFGQLKVSPWLTLALDLTILAALACTRRKNSFATDCTDFMDECPVLSVSSASSVAKRIGSGHWRLAFLFIGIAATLALSLWRMPALTASPAHPGITFASGLAILEPENWPGQPLPIMEYLDGDKAAIAKGRWTLVIYSNDCDHCRQLIPAFLTQSTITNQQPLAFVELPPYAPPGQELVPATPSLLRLRLTAAHEWFAQTPVLIHLENGIVRQIQQGNEVVLPKEPS